MRRRASLVALVAAVTSLFLLPGGASASRGLEIGFHDGLFTSSSGAERAEWLNRAVDAEAGIVRIWVYWPNVAPSKPGNPRNPADPAYDFSSIDAGVKDAAARGLDPMFTVYFAPAWAEGPGRPDSAPAGTWKPDPGALGDFATALATRYSGSFGGLPRVRYYQDWNEANLSTYLTPQYKGKKLVAADHYRRMSNAFYAGINSVNGSNKLIGSGLAPYGEPRGGSRTRPLAFWRDFFCLKGRKKLKKANCVKKPQRAHLDIMAHHPINTSGPPTQSAVSPDDVSSADLRQVTKVLRRAEKTKRVLPGGHRPLWATEFWWESDPPDPSQGYKPIKQARFIEQSMYLFWKAGASAAIALQLRDSNVTKENRSAHNATGAYFYSGKPKPALRAYQFPFVADRKNKKKVKLWGKAPKKGKIVIERKRGKRWKRVKKLKAGGNHIFKGKARLKGHAKLRAKAGREKSLTWRLK